MLKKLSAFAALMFTLFFVPMMAFANDAAEEAVVEASPMFITILAILSFATIIYMIFLNVKDHN